MVVTSDFVGKYRVNTDPNSLVQLGHYIDEYEQKYMNMLLGCELYAAYLADPLEPRFVDITNAFCVDTESYDLCCRTQKQYNSLGLQKMLTAFIWYHYVPDSRFKQTSSGSVVNKNENSEASDHFAVSTVDRWNIAVESYQAIQYFINLDLTIYPEYKGVRLKYQFMGGAF